MIEHQVKKTEKTRAVQNSCIYSCCTYNRINIKEIQANLCLSFELSFRRKLCCLQQLKYFSVKQLQVYDVRKSTSTTVRMLQVGWNGKHKLGWRMIYNQNLKTSKIHSATEVTGATDMQLACMESCSRKTAKAQC